MEKTPVKVCFVKSENGEIDAVMPFELGTNDPMKMRVYSHVGQHSSCHALWVQEQIKAKPEEYKDLLDELNNQIGYDVEVLTRFDYPSSYLQRAGKLKNFREFVNEDK